MKANSMKGFCFLYFSALLFLPYCTPVRQNNQPTDTPVNTQKLGAVNLLSLTPEKQLEAYQNIENLMPTGIIKAGRNSYPLIESPSDFSTFSFAYKDTVRTMEDFLRQTHVVGLIVVKDDRIVLERYREGTHAQTKWVNFSVAKSVTSLLFGVAIQDGYLKSLQEMVSQHVPQLKGSVYDSISLHHLLQMSSGVAWNDDPRNPESDLVKVGRLGTSQGMDSVFVYMSRLKPAAPPGSRFNYNTAETSIASIVLRNAIGKPLSEYLSERVWKPFGMHSDANWAKIANTDLENGGCCISSTLRDYALLGMFSMKDGKNLQGQQLLPSGWMKESTTSSNAFKGYGYYWWLRRNGRYFASGSFGQQIEIDPATNTVIAIQSYWPIAYNPYYVDYMDSFLDGMFQYLN
jgi:CubicO group peptidase (beta-lactamase class C family)